MQEAVLTAISLVPDDIDLEVRVMANLGMFYWAQGRTVSAIALYEKALAQLEGKLPNTPLQLLVAGNLALAYIDIGKQEEAVELEEKVLESRKALLRAGHPETLLAGNNLADSYSAAGRVEEATLLWETIVHQEFESLDHPPQVERAMIHLVNIYKQQGRWQEAGAIQEKLLSLKRSKAGETDTQALDALLMTSISSTVSIRWPLCGILF